MCKDAYEMNNTKLMRYLIGVGGNMDHVCIDENPISIKTSDTPTAVRAILRCDPNCGITLPKKLSGYDWAVHDAVCTLFMQRYDEAKRNDINITYLEIYRILAGDMDARPNVNIIQKIAQSVQRLCSVEAGIDFSHEPQVVRDYFSARKGMQYVEPLLMCGRYRETHNNKTTSAGIVIKSVPIFLAYAKAWGDGKAQLVTVPLEMLAIPMRLTDKAVAIRNYLMRYIETRRHGRLHNETVGFETILNNAGLHMADERHKRRDDCNTIKNILDFFVGQKYISGWDYDSAKESFSIRL